MQTVIQKTAPISFHDIWQSNREKRFLDNPGYDFSLRDDNDLFVPFARTLICERFPLTNLPKLWNTLSPDLSIIRNPVEFDLKQSIFLDNFRTSLLVQDYYAPPVIFKYESSGKTQLPRFSTLTISNV